MNKLKWFSSKIRLICLVEGLGGLRYMDSIFLFQSPNFDSAFLKAIELGKKQEEEYKNSDNLLVKWKLKEIISLDTIQQNSLDGAEVYSEPVELHKDTPSYNFLQEFSPEESNPTQTI